jgi:hypothetical protein
MAKKLDYKNLGNVNEVITQPRIAPDPNMPPDATVGVQMITPATIAPAAPAAVAEVTLNELAPQVTQAVVTPEVPVTSEGTPSATPDGTQVEGNSANTSTDENDHEIKEDELPEGIRKRFSKLTIKRKEAEAKAKEAEEREARKQSIIDAKEKELEFYKSVVLNPVTGAPKQEQVTSTVAPVQAPKDSKEPVWADFENSESPISDFVKAHSKWSVEQAIAPLKHQMDPAVVEQQKQDAKIVAERPDFAEVVNMKNPAYKMLADNPITNVMIPASKDKLQLAYYFAKNPAEAQRLASMTDPIDIGYELRAVREKINNPAPVVTQTVAPAPVVTPTPEVKPVQKTNAPVPFKPVNSNGSAPLPDVSTLTPDQMRTDPRYAHLFKRR